MALMICRLSLEPGDDRSVLIDLPDGAKPLTVAVKDGEPCLWVLLDPALPRLPWRFHVVPAGEELGDGFSLMTYVGTFQLPSPLGSLVFHLFF